MTHATTTPTPRPDAEGGPGWGRRLALAVGGGLAVVLAVAAVGLWWLDSRIDRVEVDGLGEPPSQTAPEPVTDTPAFADEEDPDALTVLVLGSDSREDLTPEQRRELGTGYFEGARTEVVSLVRLAPGDEAVRILSIPRDSWVERCDGSVGRINAAYEIGEAEGVGGATCTVETVVELTGLTIDHVVIVDFLGFVDIVDTLGGVSMELDEPLRDRGSHLDLPAGCVHLDGADALAFVRARQIDDDYGRIARQQRFIEELRDELADVGVLQDLPQLLRLVEAVAGSVELDDSLDLGALQRLARKHYTTVQGELEGRAAPGEVQMVGEAWTLLLDDERLSELVGWLRDGTDPAATDEDAADEGAEPGDAGEGTAADRQAPWGGGGEDPRTLAGERPAATDDDADGSAC